MEKILIEAKFKQHIAVIDGETELDWSFDKADIFDPKKSILRFSEFISIPLEWKDLPLYLTLVIWSEGDSLKYRTNSRIMVVSVSKSYEDALQIKKLIIENNKKHYNDEDSKYIILPNGKSLYTWDWRGYFEKLESVNITVCKLGEESEVT